MNLLNILTSALTSKPALHALSEKTGLSEKTLAAIIGIALPLLLKYLTSNAKSESGASSLLEALGQHKNEKPVDQQLKEADEKDGMAILGHIFGNKQDKVLNEVASEAGVDTKSVVDVLGTIAPFVLSGLSATANSANSQQAAGVDLSDGFDMGDLIGILGSAASAGSGHAQQNDAGVNGAQLIGTLLSMMQ
ncbi:MAG: DUF937 domain-containing protein [Clostridia bacterium]|nr:DUF937 domain-containing protein [Clostridia bacterium]